ncbi:MAG: hypothetical protein K0Q63_663 [Paenibacillus sp.]|nr:hypothetical protein [Paenibacillus sp.]
MRTREVVNQLAPILRHPGLRQQAFVERARQLPLVQLDADEHQPRRAVAKHGIPTARNLLYLVKSLPT